MPGHSWLIISVQITDIWFLEIYIVPNVRITIILSWKSYRILIIKRMFLSIPSSKTQIQPSHKRDLFINNDNLFMVTPIMDSVARMPQNSDIRCTVEDTFSVLRIDVESDLDLGVDNNFDFYVVDFSLLYEKVVKTGLLCGRAE